MFSFFKKKNIVTRREIYEAARSIDDKFLNSHPHEIDIFGPKYVALHRNEKPHGTALHYAAARNDLNALKVLLYYGANPNLPNKWGMTSVHYAVKEGNILMVQILFYHGADLDIACRKENKTPLEYAESLGYSEMATWLTNLARSYVNLFGNKWKTNVPDVETVERMYPVKEFDQYSSDFSTDGSSNDSIINRDEIDGDEISERQSSSPTPSPQVRRVRRTVMRVPENRQDPDDEDSDAEEGLK
ncbi:Ankyrin-2 [Trichoplax sp. H2]|nr:Ankyrin-2 [Trichoplax sp. H2]|eukprot:RDD43392.1 Ankyrin-2 [Trichoplax sp. H2]